MQIKTMPFVLEETEKPDVATCTRPRVQRNHTYVCWLIRLSNSNYQTRHLLVVCVCVCELFIYLFLNQWSFVEGLFNSPLKDSVGDG